MGKPGSQRQKEYLRRLKENNNEKYLKKEKEQKKDKLELVKINTEEYESKLQKDRKKKVGKSFGKETVIYVNMMFQP